MLYDVVIVGGGPAGLSAALALGRGRRRVLLCDSGARRNAAAERIYNFVTRDGTPPDEFRRIAREQLSQYPSVQVRDDRVLSLSGARGAFRLESTAGTVEARRVLLCTGMVDTTLPVDGFSELWGHSIFQCPYCHGWEVQDRRWGFLAGPAEWSHLVPFIVKLTGWTSDLTVFTGGLEVPDDVQRVFRKANIRVEAAPVTRLHAKDGRLENVELSDGRRLPCEALFAHPPQKQVELVRALGIELDDDGYVRVDPVKRETSMQGVYASGDLTTRMQGAALAAASGMQAAAALNAELSLALLLEP